MLNEFLTGEGNAVNSTPLSGGLVLVRPNQGLLLGRGNLYNIALAFVYHLFRYIAESQIFLIIILFFFN
jgi:hypothetical protein